jgi:hypothetical protein
MNLKKINYKNNPIIKELKDINNEIKKEEERKKR